MKIQDLVNKNISVYFGTDAQRNIFLDRCENLGLLTLSGDLPNTLGAQETSPLLTIRKGAIGHLDIEYCVSTHCTIIPFSSLEADDTKAEIAYSAEDMAFIDRAAISQYQAFLTAVGCLDGHFDEVALSERSYVQAAALLNARIQFVNKNQK